MSLLDVHSENMQVEESFKCLFFNHIMAGNKCKNVVTALQSERGKKCSNRHSYVVKREVGFVQSRLEGADNSSKTVIKTEKSNVTHLPKRALTYENNSPIDSMGQQQSSTQ